MPLAAPAAIATVLRSLTPPPPSAAAAAAAERRHSRSLVLSLTRAREVRVRGAGGNGVGGNIVRHT
jgi:hypothetical protein